MSSFVFGDRPVLYPETLDVQIVQLNVDGLDLVDKLADTMHRPRNKAVTDAIDFAAMLVAKRGKGIFALKDDENKWLRQVYVGTNVEYCKYEEGANAAEKFAISSAVSKRLEKLRRAEFAKSSAQALVRAVNTAWEVVRYLSDRDAHWKFGKEHEKTFSEMPLAIAQPIPAAEAEKLHWEIRDQLLLGTALDEAQRGAIAKICYSQLGLTQKIEFISNIRDRAGQDASTVEWLGRTLVLTEGEFAAITKGLASV
ncbi:MAG TPA: hypothetical protein VGF56_08810 [Rhizomicrobium sp.]|jgi:hypothetical protein